MRLRATLGSVLAHRRLPLAAALLAVLLTAPSLGAGLHVDDFFQRLAVRGSPDFPVFTRGPTDVFAFADGDPAHTQALMDRGMLPWWTARGLRFAFFRPLAGITHWLDYRLWPDRPWLMHAQNLLWLAALVLAVARLYRRWLGPGIVASAALLLYALDDARGLAAGWVANRNALMGGCLAVLALAAHDRWRRDGWRPGAVLGPLAFAAALSAAELAVGMAGYFLAHALFLDPARGPRRAAALAPYAAILAIWAAAWIALGYGVRGSGLYVDPLRDPAGFAFAAGERLPVLLLGQWALPSDVYPLLPPAAKFAWWLVAVVVLGLLGALLRPLLGRDPVARCLGLGMVLAAVPACATVPNDRLLVGVGIGAMGLAARLLEPLATGVPAPARAARWALAVAHGVISPLLLPVRALTILLLGGFATACLEGVAAVPDLAAHTVVMVNGMDACAGYSLVTLAALGRTTPARVRTLTSGLEALEVARPDARTLVVRAAGGIAGQPIEQLLRAPGIRTAAGERVRLAGLEVEVLDRTPDLRPERMRFIFDRPLDDRTFHWLRVRSGRLVDWRPPAVGETTRLEAEGMPF